MQIEKGVPMPGIWEIGPMRKKYVFADMKVGDSVFIKGGTKNSKEVNAARAYFRRTKKKMSYRHMDGGVRIWRTA